MDFTKFLPAQVQNDYAELKQDAGDLSDYAKAYMASQFTLQVISTLALVGIFLILSNRRR